MEVREPKKSRKLKRFRSKYLFEFVIMFFAITLGFFVENIRENLADKEREKRLMASLVEEIKADTIRINEIIALRTDRIRKNDSLIFLLNSPEREKNVRKIYAYGVNAAARRTLYYETNIMSSLRNGGFLAVSNPKAAEAIRLYYVSCNDLIATQENGDVFGGQAHNELARRVFDAVAVNQAGRPMIKFSTRELRLFTTDPAVINEFCYTVNYLNLSFNLQIARLIKMKQRAKELLQVVPAEYGLD